MARTPELGSVWEHDRGLVLLVVSASDPKMLVLAGTFHYPAGHRNTWDVLLTAVHWKRIA